MSRVALLHWNAGEAEQRAGILRAAGHEVAVYSRLAPADLRAIGQDPPDAILIELSRLPSHGREVAAAFRRQKATRQVPLLFLGGDADGIARARQLLPDASFGDWRRIGEALTCALSNVPADPVAPPAMAAYSGTPLPKKLGIRAGVAVALLGAPPGFEAALKPLPEGVRLRRDARGQAGLIVLFARSRAELRERFAPALRALAEGGGLWIAWPKKTSGAATDLTQAGVREFGLAAGLVDYKICAIDQTWSGLLFSRRRAAGRSARTTE